MNAYHLIHHIAPREHEDVVGFLMRVAERNHLGGPSDILSQITGTTHTTIRMSDLPLLADYCRNHVEELSQLSGIEGRLSDGSRIWQVAGEWISKASFISTRRARVCPACLQGGVYIPGLWVLCFYTACAWHDLQLIDHCPRCTRSLKWNRRLVHLCSCGFNLAASPMISSRGSGLLIAKLIAHRSNPEIVIQPQILPTREIERLAELSLDGLCKTIWFLGHCIGELSRCKSGHGRLQPMEHEAERIIEKALALIKTWPLGMGEYLSSCVGKPRSNSSASLLDRLLGPVQNYLHEDLQSAELGFLRTTYEQHVRMIWLAFGQKHRLRDATRQLELDLL